MLRRFVSVIVLACLIGSLFEPVIAYAKPDWWPYWAVGGYRKKCDSQDAGWGRKYCGCWMPLGWALEPSKYESQKEWRNAQWERYWKWWSRIRMNYNAMIRTKEDEAIDTAGIDRLIQRSDDLLRAVHALSVAGSFDAEFGAYFPDYDDFIPASVEEVRLLVQWIGLENAWVKSLNMSALNYEEEQKLRNKIHELIYENTKAIATAEDVLKEIIGFKIGGVLDKIVEGLKTILEYFRNIEQYIEKIVGDLAEMIKPIYEVIKKMTDFVNNIKDKINSIKDKLKSLVGWMGSAVKKIIDNAFDADKILGQFAGDFQIGDIFNKMKDMMKNLKNFKFDELLKNTWIGMIQKIIDIYKTALEKIDKVLNMLDLRSYNYGQTQVLQAVGSQAAHMAVTMNRTNREISGFMEMRLTAEHTRIARKTAIRNNMVVAGNKATNANGGKKVKLGFN
ncbi:MAG: hypothetical protein IJP53_03895 [Synergistaceae bacterium]|nr:hypothetical protein [Synergistaceae bacterium]MBR0094512.1 hypothetical protein [Synergistaceae bacterium]